MQHDYLRMHSFISVIARMFFASLMNADSRLPDPTKQRQTQQSEPGHVNTFRIETENTSEAQTCFGSRRVLPARRARCISTDARVRVSAFPRSCCHWTHAAVNARFSC